MQRGVGNRPRELSAREISARDIRARSLGCYFGEESLLRMMIRRVAWYRRVAMRWCVEQRSWCARLVPTPRRAYAWSCIRWGRGWGGRLLDARTGYGCRQRADRSERSCGATMLRSMKVDGGRGARGQGQGAKKGCEHGCEACCSGPNAWGARDASTLGIRLRAGSKCGLRLVRVCWVSGQAWVVGLRCA